MSSNQTLRRAINYTLLTGATTAAVTASPTTFAQEKSPSSDTSKLETVVVTGTRIRRVEEETANPIVVIDSAAIAQSGITSAGDLIARIPSISGAATNGQVNNGGGFGEANIELRGVEAKRTLILIDGRRVGLVGNPQTNTDATDVNQIPIAMIERVEVLKEGAGAIYGSDAIGGVVNFITKKNFEGLEINGDYGRTGKRDGDHYSASLTFGASSDRASILVGGSYFEQKAVYAGARDYSKYALYLYGGTTGVTKGGSSRTPTGRITIPTSLAGTTYPCSSANGVTRIEGASGASLSDYRCFVSPGDKFNYQPFNLLITPQERTSLFSKANFHINDYVEAYATVLYNRTHSGNEQAPLPFDAQVDDVVLSRQSIYNPFGSDFGGLAGNNPDFALRLSSIGDRINDNSVESKIFNGGVKGTIPNTSWTWDFNLSSSRTDQLQTVSGYYFKSKLVQAVGPSGYVWNVDPDHPTVPTTLSTTLGCGPLTSSGGANGILPSNQIGDCTPVNFFNPTSPDQIAAIKAITGAYNTNFTYRYQAAALDFAGPLFKLPGGDFQASVGFEYNSRRGDFIADSIVQASPPLYLQCQLSNETCTGNSVGKYDSRQFYLELYAPLLKDLPGIHALSIDAGVRYADYSLFGNTTKGDFKVEYRPISDLLVRGTFSQIFRVPTINDLAASPANTSVTFADPCNGLTQAMVNANPNLALACQNVPRDGTFFQPNGQITGLNLSNRNVKPETGHVATFGIVYEPQWVSGLSFDIDYWSIDVKGLITQLDSTFSMQQCVTTGDPTYCNLVTRFGSTASAPGGILVFQNPTINIGELKTKGIDYGVKYALRHTPIGNFQLTLDATHINSHDIFLPNTPVNDIAGTYDRQFGNFAKWRAMGGVGWNWMNIDALLTARYIDKIVVKNPSVCPTTETCNPAPGDPVPTVTHPWPNLKIPSVTYLDFNVGYTFPTQTKIQAGVQNLTDKQPPIFYQNNVTNANTNVETYDTLGRKWWVSFNQKF